MQFSNPRAVRQAIRSGQFPGPTSGVARGYVQCNLVVVPADWALEFLQFCVLNPKPCPLIDFSREPGQWALPRLGEDLDLRSDIRSYRIWEHGKHSDTVEDISKLWRDDLFAFALGCSFSFEEALLADGLEIRNISEARNVPMYRTSLACEPVGRLHGNTVVSMRPFAPANAIRATQICSRFPSVHGAPIHFGSPESIGISDIDQPDFGDPVTIQADEVPVFWACGVTPQVIIEASQPPFCITHGPGDMLVTDIPNSTLAIM